MYGPILITGGCGFVGRHTVQHVLRRGLSREIWLVDDLSTGRHPEEWLPGDAVLRDATGRVHTYEAGGTKIRFAHADARQFFADSLKNPNLSKPGLFGAAIHLASIVGGRSVIDGDPLLVATDLSIDSEMFQWARTCRPERVLFASSSAAYPIHLQRPGSVITTEASRLSCGPDGRAFLIEYAKGMRMWLAVTARAAKNVRSATKPALVESRK